MTDTSKVYDHYPKEIYGAWYGKPKGYRFYAERCAESVPHGYRSSQCSRKPGYGDRKLFCKQHAKQHPETQEVAK